MPANSVIDCDRGYIGCLLERIHLYEDWFYPTKLHLGDRGRVERYLSHRHKGGHAVLCRQLAQEISDFLATGPKLDLSEVNGV